MATLLPARLRKPQNPNLPLAGPGYTRSYQDQLNSVLRLFFNQLSSVFDALLGDRGGKYLSFPHGSFQNNGDVTLAAIDTPTLVVINVTDRADGMYLVPGDGVHVEQSGVYNVQFSAQLTNGETQPHRAFLWIRKNGADLAWTGNETSVSGTHGGQPGSIIIAANFFIELQEGDYVELWWAADTTLIKMDSLPAQTSPYARPGSPSIVLTLTFVSALSA